MKWIKRVVIFIIAMIVLLFFGIYMYLKNDASNPYDIPDPIPVDVPSFTEVEIDFNHNFYEPDHLPFMGAGIIDVDGDQYPEIWFGGGTDQEDGLFQFQDGKFINITDKWELKKLNLSGHSYGPAVYDIDQDGDEDLFICRSDDVYLYYNLGNKFAPGKALNIPLNEKSVPVSLTLGDIDNDGNVDLFVSAYIAQAFVEGQTIFTDESYGASSLLMKNMGDASFQDITKEAGLDYVHNTFVAVFIDVNGDHHLDLVVAHDTGEVRTYRNDGTGKFSIQSNPSSNHFAYPMGISVGDYNNDTKPDFFFSNVGTTMPRSLLKGDLDEEQEKRFNTKWMLFENKTLESGDFIFTDVAEETNLSNYEFGWGSVFEDFNLDGLQDLAVAENYVSLPNFKLVKLPCRFLLNTPSHKFIETGEESGVINKNFAISPLSADFNDDGYPDLVYSNLSGPARVWINNGGDANYLKVKLEQTSSALGAKISVFKNNGEELTDWLVSGEGLSSDQAHTLIYGLGESELISKVIVDYANGTDTIIYNPGLNQTLFIEAALEDATDHPERLQ